ncbi:MAG: hypothetical protein HY040_18190 [Planctomycetes bacterium]|nr:hypothetical protein [Planctomycetota bacterium]
MNTMCRTSAVLACGYFVLCLHASALPVSAGEGEKEIARVNAVFGGLVKKDKSRWQAVKAGDTISAGTLLVALPKSEITTANGAIHLSMLADIGQRGPFPVLESAVVLNHAKDADLELTFDRGLIILTNHKKEGAAKVRLKIRGETWEVTLQEPRTSVGLEIFSRHSPGMPSSLDKKGSEDEVPSTDVLMLVLHGRALLDAGDHAVGLQAPPGLARVHWENGAKKFAVQRLEKLPEILIKPFDDKEAKAFKDICLCTKKLGAEEIASVIDDLLKSENKTDRLVGATWAGAVDDLPRLMSALADAKHADTREHAVIVLRNWLGRSPEQVRALYDSLIKEKKASPAQAKNVIHLLLGFTDEERGQPDTYQMLIHLLNHSALPVRELARWHLVRLAPTGRDIPFDAGAAAEERGRGVARWQALIPEGKLPPARKTPDKN